MSVGCDLIQSNGDIKINGGRLEVKGDYRIQTPHDDGTYTYSYGKLQMTNSNDYILVYGDFVMDSRYRHNGSYTNTNLVEGILEIKGDFTGL